MSIIYLKHQDIDKLKWDTCIRNAFNGLIYAYSWYLDVAADQWDALVDGDYERVMPLPYRSSWGIERVYTPQLAPMLGVFATSKLSPSVVDEFLDAVPHRFKITNIRFNKFNNTNKRFISTKLLCMDLISVYEHIAGRYSPETTNRLEEAQKNRLQLRQHLPIGEFTAFYARTSGKLDPVQSMRLASLAKTLINLKVAEIVALYSEDNELVSAGLFVAYLNNASALACAVSARGAKLNALHVMFDVFIRSNANKNITLDCPSVNARITEAFYEGLGCRPFASKEYRKSSLMRPLNLLFN